MGSGYHWNVRNETALLLENEEHGADICNEILILEKWPLIYELHFFLEEREEDTYKPSPITCSLHKLEVISIQVGASGFNVMAPLLSFP